MKKFCIAMMWVFGFPIMIIWSVCKCLVECAYDTERSRKRRGRHLTRM